VKIGITGGSGFIGGHTIEAAIKRGHEVVVLDRRTQSIDPVYRPDPDEFPYQTLLGSVTDDVAVRELGAHVDGIIHLAACLGTQETIKYPIPAAETNLFGGLNFLETVAQYGIAGCYIGVGNHWMQNTYSITKTMIERFVQMYNNDRGTHVNIVRAMNAYGPRQSVAPPFGPAKVRKIMPSFVCRALTGHPIELYGGGTQVSDMVYVADVADVLVRMLEQSAQKQVAPPVEVGPQSGPDVRGVADMVRAMASAYTGLAPVEHVDLPMRPGETVGDIVRADAKSLWPAGKTHQDLLPFVEGAEITVDWYFRNWLPKWKATQVAIAAPVAELSDPAKPWRPELPIEEQFG